MFEIIKSVFYGFVIIAIMMVVSGIKNYQHSTATIEELLNYDAQEAYEKLDDIHKPNPNGTMYKLYHKNKGE